MMLSPIVLFVYNRLDHTQQTIEALQKNDLAKESELFIYSDAPKNESDNKKVEGVREYIKNINGFKTITIIQQKENLGLAKSIISGVSEIVNQYGKVIVMEDDLVTSSKFLNYMNNALEYYENNYWVMQVSGYAFDIKNSKENAYFLPIIGTWGWGTWKVEWSKLIVDSTPYIDEIKKQKKQFNFLNSYNYYDMLVNQTLGKNNSWGIRWYLSVYLQKGVCLYPAHSFVENIGFDGSGEHCKKTTVYKTRLANLDENIFPDKLDSNMVKKVAFFLKINRWKRVWNYLFSFK